MEPAHTPIPGSFCGACPAHLDVSTRLTAVEGEVSYLRERLAEYDVVGLKEIVHELRGDIKVLRTKLWFYQMGATAAGGLIVILLERMLR